MGKPIILLAFILVLSLFLLPLVSASFGYDNPDLYPKESEFNEDAFNLSVNPDTSMVVKNNEEFILKEYNLEFIEETLLRGKAVNDEIYIDVLDSRLFRTFNKDLVTKKDERFTKVFTSNKEIIDLGNNEFLINRKFLGKNEKGYNLYEDRILNIEDLCLISSEVKKDFEPSCEYNIENVYDYNIEYHYEDYCVNYTADCVEYGEEYCVKTERRCVEYETYEYDGIVEEYCLEYETVCIETAQECLDYGEEYCIDYETEVTENKIPILINSILTVNFDAPYDKNRDWVLIDPFYYYNGTEIKEDDFFSTWDTSKDTGANVTLPKELMTSG